MTADTTPAAIPTPQQTEAMKEQARHEAQERVAELHVEEGTVKSEGSRQNSPSPEDGG